MDPKERAAHARIELQQLIQDSDARESEKRAMLYVLDELWLCVADKAPVYPSPLGDFRRRP